MYTRTIGDIQAFLAASIGHTFMNTLHTEIGEKKLFSREQDARGFRLKGCSWQAFWQCGVFRIIIATGICFLI